MFGKKRTGSFLSQNFLVDDQVARRIVESFDVAPEDLLIEIGPGKGALTDHLAGKCRTLYLVEKDRTLARRLRSKLGNRNDVRVIEGDILELDPDLLAVPEEEPRFRIIGNLPYHITTPILLWIVGHTRHVRDALVMVQSEVAERIAATPGTKAFGALSVAVQYRARARLRFRVGKESFKPRPRVDSKVVSLELYPEPPVKPSDEGFFFALVRMLFTKRRKQIQKILRSEPRLALEHGDIEHIESETGISLRRRPEDCSVEELAALADAVRGRAGDRGLFHNDGEGRASGDGVPEDG